MHNKNVQTYSLTGDLFLKMLAQGYSRISSNRQSINDLNVFPIPDGDTGDNMCLTIESGYSQASQIGGATLGEIAGAASSGMQLPVFPVVRLAQAGQEQRVKSGAAGQRVLV